MEGLLDQLESRLRSFGAPIAGAFRPGAAPRRVEEALGGAHRDLVAWWSWHDGAEAGTPPVEVGPGIYTRPETTLVSPWHVLSVADAARIRAWLAEVGAAPESWVPVLVTDGAGELCADASGALHVRDEGMLDASAPQFSSLAEFVALLVRLFDGGLVSGAPDDPRVPWLDLAELPADARRLVVW